MIYCFYYLRCYFQLSFSFAQMADIDKQLEEENNRVHAQTGPPSLVASLMTPGANGVLSEDFQPGTQCSLHQRYSVLNFSPFLS